MNQLLTVLNSIPEYTALLDSIRNGKTAAVTGIGQINRSHMIAGLYRDTDRPLVLVCQDEIAARRLQEELKSFLGDMRAAVENALEAQPKWAAVNPQRRARVLFKFLELIAKETDSLAAMLGTDAE